MTRSPWLWFAAALFVIATGCGGGGAGVGVTNSSGGSGGIGSGLARVTGRIITSGTAIGIQGLRVTFHSSNGAMLGQAVSGADGTFQADIAPTATSFNLDPASITSAYHRYFIYGTASYAPNIDSCRAPLPSLTVGQATALPGGNIRVPLSVEPPPPPPTGCS